MEAGRAVRGAETGGSRLPSRRQVVMSDVAAWGSSDPARAPVGTVADDRLAALSYTMQTYITKLRTYSVRVYHHHKNQIHYSKYKVIIAYLYNP